MEKQWEYQWVPCRRPDMELLLGAMGKNGWEGYAVTEETNMAGQSTGDYTVFMKRPLPQPSVGSDVAG